MADPQQLVARYAIYGEIASGGMAKVHFGRLLGPVGFSRTVAIKRLHAHYAGDPEFVSMLLDEARLAARITHTNVVSTLDVVAEGGEVLLVMEYVQGEALAKLLRESARRGEPVPPRIAATILTGVLHGLHAAHEAKDTRGVPLEIVHRDVSPQNVMVGIDGVARVLDFGVAKASGRTQMTRDGQVKGKLAYMAPEQLAGSVTRQSDIFAASIVLWETLTCRRLFGGSNEGETLTKVTSLAIEPPSNYVDSIPAALDAVVLRGLERDPSRRFATAREMALAIEQCAPLAPASEVGAWVQSLAAEVIEERARNLAEIESNPSVVPEPVRVSGRAPEIVTGSIAMVPVSQSPPAPVARGRDSRVAVASASVALVAVVVLGGIALVTRRHAPESQGEARPRGSAEEVLSAAAPASEAPPADAGLSSTTALVASAHKTAPRAVRAGATRALPSATARDKCDPPYERAADGKLVPKQGCL